jgi:hypothetical protein
MAAKSSRHDTLCNETSENRTKTKATADQNGWTPMKKLTFYVFFPIGVYQTLSAVK